MTHEEQIWMKTHWKRMSIDANGKWIPPQDNVRDVLTRYLLTYGITHKQAATEIRRELKVILAELQESK
jgi:hypothetical protein